jgi:hypothetical protein
MKRKMTVRGEIIIMYCTRAIQRQQPQQRQQRQQTVIVVASQEGKKKAVDQTFLH